MTDATPSLFPDARNGVTVVWDHGILDGVPFPRVPVVGEKVIGPDDMGTYVVASVTYEFPGGLGFEPTTVVVVVRNRP